LYVPVAQYGLGCYERWLAGDGDEWFDAALETGRYLVEQQEHDGSWLFWQRFPHTFPMALPWRCGMAQGEAASLLVRLYLETHDEVFADAASRAVAPLLTPVHDGGVNALLGGQLWPEEYPTDPPSFVLNGAIFAWWGFRDVGIGLGDAAALRAFDEGVDTLAANLHRFDSGGWSLYCLRRYPVAHIASSFYHALHIAQLDAMNAVAPRAEFVSVRARWIGYVESAPHRRRALVRKVLFRLIVPRNRLLALRLPWTRL
jgi:heparosan-N-sulfate-glucuronate 5-epimerase